MSIFLVGKILGEEGKEFTQWSLEEFTAWGKVSYRKRDNSFVPMLTDGTNLEGYVWRLNVAKPYPADPSFFWVYSVAYRTTGDEFMWEMVRDIVLGNDFGDIGETPAHTPELQTNTTFSHAYGVFGFLELYAKTKNPAYLEMARRIGDNILSSQFHKGFFVPSKRHIYTRFDCFEPLALLHLEAAMKSKIGSVPRVWPSVPLFVPPYRYKQHGVDLRVIYALTESPEPPLSLQEAAAIGDVELVRSLLDKGVGVDSWDDSRKKTALQRAAISGHKDVVELLLAKGADIDAGKFYVGTALYYAAENGHKEIAELLIAKGADVNAIRRAGGDTPLHSAAMVGHKDIVELLIANGADVNAKNNKGQTPVDIAASRNRSKVVKLLIEKGADVSFHLAVRFGALAKVKSLIEEGVDINAKDGSGKTALYYAARTGHKDIVKLLLVKGADANLASGDDDPLLNVAIWNGDTELAKLLVNHGAKFDMKDEDGRTAFRYAAGGGRRELVEFFVSKGADISSFHMAACVGDLTRVKHLVDEGANVDTKDEFDWTPLCWAASTGQTDVAEFLIANGANVDAKTHFNRTPLHQAAIVGELNLVQLFISRGANVSVKDWRGRTPLRWAERRGHTEIAELLRKHIEKTKDETGSTTDTPQDTGQEDKTANPKP
jgi:ankyrin repeat protein